MQVYTVHYRPGPGSLDPDLVLIKEGFCWPAFLLNALWALWHRLWIAAIVFLGAGALLELGSSFFELDPASGLACSLGLGVMIGFVANRLAPRGATKAGLPRRRRRGGGR